MNTSKTAQLSASMATGSVSSADGTTIGYLRVGQGPAVVILHGSNESARSHTQLALALADAFTVYLPDRRGRGGPARTGPATACAPRSRTFRPSWPEPGRTGCSRSASGA